MKKRKSPILLISLLVIMLIGIAILNTPKSDSKGSTPVVDAGREADSASEMAKAQKKVVSKTPVGGPKSPREEMRPDNGQPSIKVSNLGDARPQPQTDGSQIGQWYSDESAAKNEKVKVTSPPR